MKTFNEHVGTFTPSQFPMALKTSAGSQYLPRVCELLNKFAEGPVPNPDYQNIKSLVSTVIENAVKKPEWLYVQVFRKEPRLFTLWDIDPYSVYPHELAGKLKKLQKAKPQNPDDKTFLDWAIPVLTEVQPLADALLAMKERVFKRVPKTAEQKATEKQRYIAPMGSMESGQAVTKVLTELTNRLKDDYATAVASYFITVAERFSAMDVKDQREKARFYADVNSMYDAWDHATRHTNEARKLAKGYKAVFTKEAAKVAADMQQSFVYKNSRKLVSILEKKGIGLAKDPVILRAAAARGVFEGEIRIEFADGSSFEVRNKIVLKQNQYGTVFNQFPTTFHNVVLPGGKPMALPSEERMNDVFAVTKG